jgi:hypothetical protein
MPVPKSHILLEAFMRLYARDFEHCQGGFAMAMVDYMELYVDEDGLLDVTLLPEPLQSFYRVLKEGKMPMLRWTRELRRALGIGTVEDVEVDEDC